MNYFLLILITIIIIIVILLLTIKKPIKSYGLKTNLKDFIEHYFIINHNTLKLISNKSETIEGLFKIQDDYLRYISILDYLKKQDKNILVNNKFKRKILKLFYNIDNIETINVDKEYEFTNTILLNNEDFDKIGNEIENSKDVVLKYLSNNKTLLYRIKGINTYLKKDKHGKTQILIHGILRITKFSYDDLVKFILKEYNIETELSYLKIYKLLYLFYVHNDERLDGDIRNGINHYDEIYSMGLVNLGSVCHRNAIIQGLKYIDEFAEKFPEISNDEYIEYTINKYEFVRNKFFIYASYGSYNAYIFLKAFLKELRFVFNEYIILYVNSISENKLLLEKYDSNQIHSIIISDYDSTNYDSFGGHSYTYAKKDNIWYLFDDVQVTKKDPSDMLFGEQRTYIIKK
jgi:hypothetical protein